MIFADTGPFRLPWRAERISRHPRLPPFGSYCGRNPPRQSRRRTIFTGTRQIRIKF